MGLVGLHAAETLGASKVQLSNLKLCSPCGPSSWLRSFTPTLPEAEPKVIAEDEQPICLGLQELSHCTVPVARMEFTGRVMPTHYSPVVNHVKT